MENFLELLKERKSYRKYTDEKLSPDEVKQILQAALMSPASKRSNGWDFIAVEDKEMLQKLSQCKQFGARPIANAALAIVVMADPLISDVWIEDASIATILMQLEATSLGLGSCWIQIRERYTESGVAANDLLHEWLDIPIEKQVLSILAIGHKDEERKPFDESRLQWEKVHIDKW